MTKRIYTVFFWNQDPAINDCAGNVSNWVGAARSMREAMEKAAKGHSFFRIKKVKVKESRKESYGFVTTSEYEIAADNLYVTFKREHNAGWMWTIHLPKNPNIVVDVSQIPDTF